MHPALRGPAQMLGAATALQRRWLLFSSLCNSSVASISFVSSVHTALVVKSAVRRRETQLKHKWELSSWWREERESV